MNQSHEGMVIYADHAATTAVRREVLEKMLPFFSIVYGNPSSIHQEGQKSKKAMEEARRKVAAALGASAREIVFTSGGTESDNQALMMGALSLKETGRHIVTSAIEHPAVLNTCRRLEKRGFDITYVMPGRDGMVPAEAVEKAMRPDTILVSLMMANNETGAIQPVDKVGEMIRHLKADEHRKILFHVDAVQAFGKLPIRADQSGVDLLSVSSHKIYGPKGEGALYIRQNTDLGPLLTGGGQEGGRRSGTENVPAIAGFGEAADLSEREREQESERLRKLRDFFIQRVMAEIPGVQVNGNPEKCLPGHASLRFEGVDAEALLILLDMKGICASAGSACSAGALEPSHVLTAMGLSRKEAASSLRFTFGRENTMEQMPVLCETLKELTEHLRATGA